MSFSVLFTWRRRSIQGSCRGLMLGLAAVVGLAIGAGLAPSARAADLITYDVFADWSDTSNPNGAWSYELRGALAPSQSTGATWGSGGPFGWSRVIGTEPSPGAWGDWSDGDVLGHSPNTLGETIAIAWTRACGHSFECEATAGEVYHRGKACVGFFVSRGDAPELLEIVEEILDEMAPFVHPEVARDRAHPIGLGWNYGHGASAVQFGADPVDVEGLVGQQGLEVDPLDQRRNADAVVALAGKQQEARQVAERIDERDDFRRQPASRSADGLILSPPLAPVPCWWTRTMVPSMMAYSKSGSGDNSLNRLSNTPFSAHRRKRR